MTMEYRIEVHGRPDEIPAHAWNDLLQAQSAPTPFMRHEFLAALHESGSAVAETGWTPCPVTVWQGRDLVAACPAYLKSHSYGEYVFDWAWADAYRRHGLHYYPKLLVAVPFTPVPGTRLMGRDDHARRLLVRALHELAASQRLSSAHLLFLDETDRLALAGEGWMLREGVQFHWMQDAGNPVRDFDDLLSRMRHDKRKKIRQDRRRVSDQGVDFEVLEGEAIDAPAWDFFHRCYTATYASHHSTPYLTREFFTRMAQAMPQHWVMFVASQGGERVAASLVAVDPGGRSAWGRYWGCTRTLPGLHFEACYHQPLQWCLSRGYERFEGGAQGEHKMARGLMPTPTWSAHWLADTRFADAVQDFLGREGAAVDAYLDELRDRSPFREGVSRADASSSPPPG